MGERRRTRGSGSIFLRGDGLWVGRIPRGTGTAQVTSKLFCEAARKFSELHPYRPEFAPRVALPRSEAMRAARALGSHTAAEWHALVRSVRSKCRYCGVTCSPLNAPPFRISKDHRIPISRGGSDAIENIVVACKRCNSEKSTATEEEFLSLRRPRPQGWAS